MVKRGRFFVADIWSPAAFACRKPLLRNVLRVRVHWPKPGMDPAFTEGGKWTKERYIEAVIGAYSLRRHWGLR